MELGILVQTTDLAQCHEVTQQLRGRPAAIRSWLCATPCNTISVWVEPRPCQSRLMPSLELTMPSIPYRTMFDTAAYLMAEAIRARRGGRLLDLDRMLLYSSHIAQGWGALMGPIRNAGRKSARHRELAICAVTLINRAD